ncbi:MAG: FHA domain-containing protein [Pseudonocardiaceae bacterium]
MTATVISCCPLCGEPRIGPFCEQCGHSYTAAATPVPSSWYAVIAPDRAYFEAGGRGAHGFTFPDSNPPRSIALTGTSMLIGRHSASRGITPEIDLAEMSADPGISREHARLVAQSDGRWAVVDEGSTNGTYVNGGRQPIPAHQQVPLADGDRVHLGAWTTITLCRSL